jgi:broad specificity phosphatase PhoE
MKLWWVRHGPTHAKTMVGWTDLPADLTDTAALNRLSTFLPNASIISSDLSRAVETANAIEASRTRLEHSQGLREINFGDWENRSFADVEGEDAALLRSYWEQPGDIAPPGGESWNAVEERVNGIVDTFAKDQENIIVVAHMGVILTQVRRALQISAYEAFSHKIDNLSVTCTEFTDGKWQANLINHRP